MHNVCMKESEITKVAKYFMSTNDDTSLKIPPLKEVSDSVQVVQEEDIIKLFFQLYIIHIILLIF